MYFQYDSAGTPVGFVYNDVQYLYIINQNGDVIGIADAEGTPLVEYVYDEWGKLLEIYTAEEGNEEQLVLAQANPLRYRGYYYDNETGYYYLQSRYYDPELCRFISADSFDYIDADSSISINAYVYCANSPNLYADYNGFDFTWATVFDIISACLIIDSLFPGFRLHYVSERTKNKFVPRKDSRKKAGQHKKVGFVNEMLNIQTVKNTAKHLREAEYPMEMVNIVFH